MANTFVDGIALMRQVANLPAQSVPDPKSPKFPLDALVWFGPKAQASCEWTLRITEMQDRQHGDKPAKYFCQTRQVFIRP